MCVCQQRYESWVKNSISSKCATGQLHEHTEMDEIISSLSLTLKQRDLDIKRTHTGLAVILIRFIFSLSTKSYAKF